MEFVVGERAASVARGVVQTEGDRLLAQYAANHRLKLQQVARFLLGHRSESDTESVIRALKGEDLLRRVGDGDISSGRATVARLVVQNRYVGKHPGKSRTSVVAAKLSGAFHLCPLCGLLVYRRSRSVQPSGRVWHQPCLLAWEWTPNVRGWLDARRRAKAAGVSEESLEPFPAPPSLFPRGGAPISSDSLMANYGALLRSSAGVNVAQLAREAGVSRQSMQDRLAAIRGRLPASWGLVFQSMTRGVDARQQLYPLPNVGLGQRAAAKRMAELTIPSDVVSAITGVSPACGATLVHDQFPTTSGAS